MIDKFRSEWRHRTAANMTTVIMISNDNSVIITNSDDSNLSTLSGHGQSVAKTPAKMSSSNSGGDKPVSSRTIRRGMYKYTNSR